MTSNGWKGISEYAIFLREAGGNGKRTTTHASLWKRYGISAMVEFQFHLIAQIDDSTQVIFENIRAREKFAHALKADPIGQRTSKTNETHPFRLYWSRWILCIVFCAHVLCGLN
jgi:hypothetical protein